MFKKSKKSKACFFWNFLGSGTYEVGSSYYFYMSNRAVTGA